MQQPQYVVPVTARVWQPGSADEAALVTIAATLTQYGVPYLRTSAGLASIHPSPPPLEPCAYSFSNSLQHSEPRVYEALIPLSLRHPEFHPCVQELAAHLDAESSLKTAAPLHGGGLSAKPLAHQPGSVSGPMPQSAQLLWRDRFWAAASTRSLGRSGTARVGRPIWSRKPALNWLSSYESACSRLLWLSFNCSLSPRSMMAEVTSLGTA